MFHTATGTMDLLNSAGAQVQSIQFARGSHEYAAPNTGALLLTTNPAEAGNLPVTFVH